MPTFLPSSAPQGDARSAAWLYFRGTDVWLDAGGSATGGGALHESPHALSLSPTRSLFVGTLDDRPCFAAEVEAGVLPDAAFVPLRSALMTLGPDHLGVLSAAAELLHFEQTHRFCGRCAGSLVDSAADRGKRCPACRVDFYPRIAPAVIVLVHDGPRLLLTHVGNRPFWALVAGFLEPGETLEQCAAREVREETGIAVDDLRYFGSQPWPFPSQVMVGFIARHAGGEIAVDRKELDEAGWFPVDALPPVPPPLSIARRMIDALVAEMKGGEATA
jgi:NAD+ diphosphatase